MTHAWVVGRGGLLGSAIERQLRRRGTMPFEPDRSFPWDDDAALRAGLDRQCTAFTAAVPADASWEIYWTAGVGTAVSSADELDPETGALAHLMRAIVTSSLRPSRGRVLFASSAGAVYAGSVDPVVCEDTTVRPTSAYGHAKLRQEAIVSHAASRVGLPVLIARIATLYGAGGPSGRSEGLLTHMSRCIARNTPIRIYAPLDTIRDYIAADDAAELIVDALRLARDAQCAVKIVASETPATIAQIVSVFKRISRRNPRIVTSAMTATEATAGFSRRIQFRSCVAPPSPRRAGSLRLGIADLLVAERRRYVASAVSSGSPSARPADEATRSIDARCMR